MALELMTDTPATESATTEELYPEGSIRMVELSVYNWGTFSGLHTGRFDEQGTLITGHTGAGKSTFADAWQPLLLPLNHTKFNVAAAQSEEKDRSPVTYIRGKLGNIDDANGRTSSKFKRTQDTLSGIRALYRTERGNEITLAALFWMPAGATTLSEVSRGYVVAHGNYGLKVFLDGIRNTERGNVRWDNLSSQYKGRKDIILTQSFDAYAAAYRARLWMEDVKAPALLARAMGLKRISDLTDMVRELVLEEPTTRETALSAINEFKDLKSIHSELLLARSRRDTLKELPERNKTREAEVEARDRAQKLLNVLPAWHAAEAVRLLEEVIVEETAKVATCKRRQAELDEQVELMQNEWAKAKSAYEAAGGANLDKLEASLEEAKASVEERQTNCRSLDGILEKLHRPAPREGWTEAALSSFKEDLRGEIEQTTSVVEGLQQQQVDARVKEAQVKPEITRLETELVELMKRKDSNIHSDYLRMRRELAESTGIAIAELPFLGELIDVKATEAVWRGAIERALGFVRLKLIIPPHHRKSVRDYFDDHKMGMRVGFVVTAPVTGMSTFRPDSFLHKLEWGQSPARDWLKRHLTDNHSLDCVEAHQMDNRPYCMTVNGLIQYKVGTYEKDDSKDISNPLFWYMGFSNEGRRELLQNQLRDLRKARDGHQELAADLQRQISKREAFARDAKAVLDFDWASIDVAGARAAVTALEITIAKVKANDKELASARVWEIQCRLNLKNANEDSKHAAAATLQAEERLEGHRRQHERQMRRAATIVDPALPTMLGERFHPLTKDDLGRSDEIESDRKTKLQGDLTKATNAVSLSERRLSEMMTEYRTRFPDQSVDLPNPQQRGQGEDSETFGRVMAEWAKHFAELVDSKLPELVERFQSKLNRETKESFTTIRQSIDAQREEILERIEQINSILERTEIKNGTHLSLVATELTLEPAVRFDDQLKLVTRSAAGSDPEAHFAALAGLIELLERATNTQTRNNKDTRCQLDARFRMAFALSEWRPPTGKDHRCPIKEREIVFTHRDTKGKSGGEKEGFSGLVVASALAYVLTPKGARKPSYCTVALDEAFANTSDGLAKRVLKVFRELGLHLNLITPFKNVELARTAVRSALVVEIDGQSDSHLSEVTWEEIDRQRLAADPDGPIAAEAKRLNVSFEVVEPA